MITSFRDVKLARNANTTANSPTNSPNSPMKQEMNDGNYSIAQLKNPYCGIEQNSYYNMPM